MPDLSGNDEELRAQQKQFLEELAYQKREDLRKEQDAARLRLEQEIERER